MRHFLVVTMLVLLTPAAASASALTGERDEGGTTIFTYDAAPGEANAVDVTIDGRTITVTDPGATIETSRSCTVAAGVATCQAPRFFAFVAILEDGDDSLTLPAAADGGGFVARRVEGGAGNDTIDASSLVLVGGDGDDRLTSDRISASLLGGSGADVLTGTSDSQDFQGGPGADTIEAGDGDGQMLSYAEATEPVTADLGTQGAMGPAGDQDTVAGIDGVIGGRGDDQLTGNGAGNKLVGGLGDDTIAAGGGPDDIVAGKGDDTIDAGPGDDELRDTSKDEGEGTVLDGGAGDDDIRATGGPSFVLGGDGNDRLVLGAMVGRADGGAGRDVLFARNALVAPDELSCGDDIDQAEDFRRTPVPLDCEEIGFHSPKVELAFPNRITLDGRRLTVPVPNLCLKGCQVTAQVIVGDRGHATETVKLPNRRNGKVTFELKAPAVRAIRKPGYATVLYSAKRGSFFFGGYVTFPLG